MAISRQTLGEDNPKVAEMLMNIAEVCENVERHSEAASYFDAAADAYAAACGGGEDRDETSVARQRAAAARSKGS